jgi:hypothetical protein
MLDSHIASGADLSIATIPVVAGKQQNLVL